MNTSKILSIFFLIADTYFKTEALADKLFRARFTVTEGDKWTTELTNQNSLRFLQKVRDYRERINLVLRRSDLRNGYEGSEILALDGYKINFNFYFLFIHSIYLKPKIVHARHFCVWNILY